MHTYTICIGSNYNREATLLWARKQLTALFPSICFADEEETEPFLLHNPARFTNQVARFRSSDNVEETTQQLKRLEAAAGRTPEDKAIEKVILDIDLLMCDDTILKPKDMAQPYVMRGIAQLRNL